MIQRNPYAWHPFDWVLLGIAPVVLVGLTATLSSVGQEADHTDPQNPPSGVIVEVAGHSVRAALGGEVLVVGRGSKSAMRMLSVATPDTAALLISPRGPKDPWLLVPGGSEPAELELESVVHNEEGRALRAQLSLWDRSGWGNPAEVVATDHRTTLVLVPERRAAGAERGLGDAVRVRAKPGAEEHLLHPWDPPLSFAGVQITMAGTEHTAARLALHPSLPVRCPGGAPCVPAEWEVQEGDGGPVRDRVGPLRLDSGDVVRIGSQRFLARGRTGSRDHAVLDLFYVRQPKAPSLFPTSSGADLYHPAAGLLWNVPPCLRERRLVLGPRADAEEEDRTLLDRGGMFLRGARERTAIREFAGGAGADAGSLRLCFVDREGDLRVVLEPDPGRRVSAETAAGRHETLAGPVERSLGRRDRPGEMIVTLGGALLRIAPAAGERVHRRTLWGAAAFLALLAVIQAIPLSRSRNQRRQALKENPGWVAESRASARWCSATLLQLVGIAISAVLLVGLHYHILLALHPQLAGDPRYLQAFLQAVVLVGVLLTGASWFAWGELDPSARVGRAATGAGIAFLVAWAWWSLDAAMVPETLWLREMRSSPAVARAEAWRMSMLAMAAALLLAPGALGLLWRVPWRRSRPRQPASPPPRRDAWWAGDQVLRWRWLLATSVLAAAVAVGVGLGALFFHAVAMAVLALIAALLWSRARGAKSVSGRDVGVWLSMACATVLGVSVILFLMAERHLPTGLNYLLFGLGGVGALWVVGRSLRHERTSSMVVWWVLLGALGAVASVGYGDMGSAAVWLPTVLAGFYLWIVRPEETSLRSGDRDRAWNHLLLAVASGLLLLGSMDVFGTWAEWTTDEDFARARQRVLLTRDVSYNSGGEWIAEVRWLVSEPDRAFTWIGNLNSDLAIFGVGSTMGGGWKWLVTLLLIAVAALLLWGAEQGLQEGRAAYEASSADPLPPVLRDQESRRRAYPAWLLRALGMYLGMMAVLLLTQWLVHITTGVVLHLPITGLGLPWVSHANGTHMVFTAAIAYPLAILAAVEEWTPRLARRSFR